MTDQVHESFHPDHRHRGRVEPWLYPFLLAVATASVLLVVFLWVLLGVNVHVH